VKRYIVTLFFAFLLTGCTSSGGISIPQLPSSTPSIAFDSLYLRGVFNWWEATPAYKFKQGSGSWYVDVELIADGQPYDFKLSDANWSPSQSCGAKYKGQPVMIEATVYLICQQNADNLQFTPSSTGIYRFSISAASAGEVTLIITKR